MNNLSQDERRKMEDEKHHPYDKSTRYSNKKSHVYKNPYFLSNSLNKMFPKKNGNKNA